MNLITDKHMDLIRFDRFFLNSESDVTYAEDNAQQWDEPQWPVEPKKVFFNVDVRSKLVEYFSDGKDKKGAYLLGYYKSGSIQVSDAIQRDEASSFRFGEVDLVQYPTRQDKKYLVGVAVGAVDRKSFFDFKKLSSDNTIFIFPVINQKLLGCTLDKHCVSISDNLVLSLFIQTNSSLSYGIPEFDVSRESSQEGPSLWGEASWPVKPCNVHFPENVVQQLIHHFVQKPIEQGAFLFGTAYKSGKVVISDAIHDVKGSRSGASYTVSKTADDVFLNYQRQANNKKYIVGIAHSHPGSMYFPSGQDRNSFVEFLQLNPEYSSFIFPIVCKLPLNQELQKFQARICDDWVLNLYIQTKESFDYGIPHFPSSINTLIPDEISNICDTISQKYHWILHGRDNCEIQGVPVSSFLFTISSALLFRLIFLPGYPLAPPVFTVSHNDVEVAFPPLEWDWNIPGDERLMMALSKFVFMESLSVARFSISWGPSLERAFYFECLESHWRPYLCARGDCFPLFTRVDPIVSAVVTQPILVMGCGSVGSSIADQLVRAGCVNITLVDIELVKYQNIARAIYTLDDVGSKKIHALQKKLKRINSKANIVVCGKNIISDPYYFLDLVKQQTIIIAATDDPFVQERINKMAYLCGKIAVFTGVYDKGKGGEVLISSASFQLPCHQCLINKTSHDGRPMTRDYGIEKLESVVSLGSDISFVSTLASKVIMALLLTNSYRDPPSQEDDSYRLWKFGQNIKKDSFCYFKMSFYEDFQKSLEKEIRFVENSHISGNLWVWFSPRDLPWVKESRTICSTCCLEEKKRSKAEEVKWTTTTKPQIDWSELNDE